MASLGWNVNLYSFGINDALPRIVNAVDDPGSPAFNNDVVNASWVYEKPGYSETSDENAVRDLITMGIVVVASTGNSRECVGGNCARVYYPAAFNFPALGLGAQVIAVSATDQNDEFVDGYVYSPGANPIKNPDDAFIDVAAPGKDITLLFSTGNGERVPFTPATAVADGTS